MINKLKYVSSCMDYSGYGNAARKNIIALKKHHVKVTVTEVPFASNRWLVDPLEAATINSLPKEGNDYDHIVIHLTPENYKYFIEPDKINVGHLAWETTRLHSSWVPACNKMDAMLVPSFWNKEVLINSGVTVPIDVFPHAYDVNKFDELNPTQWIANQFSDHLKFYSVFQWSERKNPSGLLRSYLATFSSKDKTVLFLKTYSGSGSDSDKDFVVRQIKKIQESLNKTDMPKVLLLPDLMNDKQLNELHLSCDCYLAPVRGEGFGMPILDAALAGNQVIATDFGGQKDFMHRELHNFLPYQLRPVSDMNWIPWYNCSQEWADPDLSVMSDIMMGLYKRWLKGEDVRPKSSHPKLFMLYKEWLTSYYSNEAVAQKLLDALESIGK